MPLDEQPNWNSALARMEAETCGDNLGAGAEPETILVGNAGEVLGQYPAEPDGGGRTAGSIPATGAYHMGWQACMRWEDQIPPAGLDADNAAKWLAGWRDAFDHHPGDELPDGFYP